MNDPKGFLKYKRETPATRKVDNRIKDYKDIYQDFSPARTQQQASRCMDCGVPFCHSGCPLGNVIPEFNEAVHDGNWPLAYEILSSTNNFPEFTGRICPAPCEAACVLGINQAAVAIEHIEKSIAEMAFEKGLVRPEPPSVRHGQQVAIVGSGPAGLAAADQLNKAGYWVTVFERSDRIGGLLRYGIPDFKLEKHVLERRLAIMKAEGIRFKTQAEVGGNIDAQNVLKQFDAVLLCGGATVPRDLDIPGRDLGGVHFAMDYLEQSNREQAGDQLPSASRLLTNALDVVVIGGGDTGADCVGTANRQGANSVTQIELLTKPPATRAESTPWPRWPMMLRTSSSHEEGCDRQWAILTKAFLGDEKGHLRAIQVVGVDWQSGEDGQAGKLREIPSSEREIPCQMALLSVGFKHPQFEGLLDQLGIQIDERGNVRDEGYRTNIDKVFVAGDMRRGQSLVVWAIAEGREAASAIISHLQKA